MTTDAQQWMDYIQNPNVFATKKYMWEMLKERYPKHERFLNRFCHYLVTREDVEDFGALIADAYEIGFLKAVQEYQGQLQKLGYKAKIVAEKEKEETPSIFPSQS